MKTAICLLGLFAASAFVSPAFADNSQFDIRYVFDGKLEQTPITLVLNIEDDTDHGTIKVLDGHYFYDEQMVDIPVSVDEKVNSLILRGADGSQFTLRPMVYLSHPWNPDISPAATVNKADFFQGIWTLGSRTIPVKLSFAFSGGDQNPDAASEAYARQFIQGVVTDDPKKAADAVSYPMTINGRCGAIVRNKAAFLADWHKIATPALVAELKNAVPHDMFGKDGLTMIGTGDVWFGDKGAHILNIDCPARRRSLKRR